MVTATVLAADGQRAGFFVLAGFLGSFAFIRTSARLMRSPSVPWWPGSVKVAGGVHIHHLVWGIVLLLLVGFLEFALQPESPVREAFAAVFGIGAGLTLDEFALWLRLEDVYWSQEGRRSVDAVIVAALIGGMVVLGGAPFGIEDAGPATGIIAAVLTTLPFICLALLKGKVKLSVVGLFVPPVAWLAAVRLGKPHSPWARWRYRPGGEKLARAVARDARLQARRNRVLDRATGAPSVPEQAEGPPPRRPVP
jgi:hypothetical protein